MKKENILKIISFGLNLFVIATTLYACIYGVQREMKVVPDFTRITYFNYFTTLSNVYNGLVAIVVIIMTALSFKKKENEYPKWIALLHLSAVVGVALTFLTCVVFLAPMEVVNHRSYWGMFKEELIFVHFLNPVVSIVDFIFLHRYKKMNWKCAFWGIIPMCIYGAIYTSFVVSGKWNDFYGFTFGGKLWLAFLVLPIMICVTYSISFLLVISKKRRQK